MSPAALPASPNCNSGSEGFGYWQPRKWEEPALELIVGPDLIQERLQFQA